MESHWRTRLGELFQEIHSDLPDSQGKDTLCQQCRRVKAKMEQERMVQKTKTLRSKVFVKNVPRGEEKGCASPNEALRVSSIRKRDFRGKGLRTVHLVFEERNSYEYHRQIRSFESDWKQHAGLRRAGRIPFRTRIGREEKERENDLGTDQNGQRVRARDYTGPIRWWTARSDAVGSS